MTKSRLLFTISGFLAVVLWAAAGGINRQSGEAVGPWVTLAGAHLFGFVMIGAATLLAHLVGRPSPASSSSGETATKGVLRKHLLLGALYAVYQLTIFYAIGAAADRIQTLAVLLLNMLWPSLTLLALTLSFGGRVRALFPLGILFSLAGAFFAIKPPGALDLESLAQSLSAAPLPLLIAFLSGFLWAAYNVASRKFEKETPNQMIWNMGIAFLLAALVAGPSLAVLLSPSGWPVPLLVLGVVNNAALLFWEAGVRKGHTNWVVLGGYFSPILVSLFMVAFMGVPATAALLLAGCLVTIGALICRASVVEAKADSPAN